MQISRKIKYFFTFILVNSTLLFAYGQNFSCNYGKQAACIDYGDKICSSMSKCVSQDAICFDSYTCGYDGFICKSKYNDIVDEYNTLLRKYKDLATDYDSLADDYNTLLRKYKNTVSDHEDLQSCISYASTLEEAKNCY